MGRNIKYQFLNALNKSFNGGGKDKHAAKHVGKYLDTVYSYAERKNLTKLTSQISDFLKENYSDVKMLYDINNNMVQAFFNKKAESKKCNNETLQQYRSRINKLQHVVNDVYNIDVNWYKDLIVPSTNNTKKRTIAMSKEHYNAILDRAYKMNSKSQAIIAVELAGRFGLRVSETCKIQKRDIDLENNILHVHESKGKRSRVVKLNCDSEIKFRDTNISNREFLKNLYDSLGKKDERAVNIKEDSVNAYLARAESALGFRSIYKEADTGVHCIRKAVAQELYDNLREEGKEKREVLNEVSHFLGHGDDRDECIKAYVLNIY